ncbi:CAP domain-containing protein, partial [Myxococcota bacterium]|nr:CAP domain-containing protein [Myxococcota bacterium]
MLRSVGLRAALIFATASLPSTALGYGEPSAGVPSAEERLLHVLTNQVRADPHAWPGWNTSLATGEPRPALGLDQGLLDAARFHADDMATNDFFAHESSDGTSFGARVGRFFGGGAAGENIYMATFGGPRDGITAWMNSTTGHRENILEPSWNLLGTGAAITGAARYYVQDFGQRGGTAVPPIAGAAFERIGGGRLRVLVSWWDAAGRAPSSLVATLGGADVALSHAVGGDGNAIWSAEADEPSPCTPLWVTAAGPSGTTVFPTTGALLVGSSCSEDFTPSRAGGPSPDGGTGGGGGGRPVIDAAEGCACVVPGTAR